MWPLSLAAVVRAKIGDGRLQRKIALEGHRFTPREALESGIVDHLVNGNTDAILSKAEYVADSVNSIAREGVWGIIKVSPLDLQYRSKELMGSLSDNTLS